MTAHPIDTEALRKLADAATPGPWETFKTNLGRDNGIGSASPTVPSDEAVMEDAWSDPADAEFIAAAREAVPALLDRIARLEAQSDTRGRAVVIYRERAREAEAERDWNIRSSRLAKEERIKANARAAQAEARVRHLEGTARVLVREVIAAEDARDEHRRGKAAAEARVRDLTQEVRDERGAALDALEQIKVRDARIKAVEDALSYADMGETLVTRSRIRRALDSDA